MVCCLWSRIAVLSEEQLAKAEQAPAHYDDSLEYSSFIPPEPLDAYDPSPEKSRRIYEASIAEVRAAMELDEDYRRQCEELFAWQAGEDDTDGATT